MSDTVRASPRALLERIVDFPLIAMLVAILLYAAATALSLFLGKFVSIGQPGTAFLHMVITLTIVLTTYKLAIARVGQHPRDDLPAKKAIINFGWGFATGAIIFSAIVGIAAVLGVYRVTGAGSPADIVLPVISASIMPGFMEELLFRGILFRWIEEFAGSWTALLITSALFGLAHIFNPGATWFSSFAIAMEAGLLLGGAYMLTRSLWMPIGLHLAWNFTQGPIFGVPVSGGDVHGLVQAKLVGPDLLSGGAFGLEASVIAPVVATAAGVWFLWLAARRGEVIPPGWGHRRALNSLDTARL
jgi:uncharacterized protein